jgi:dienelactone hydrolase
MKRALVGFLSILLMSAASTLAQTQKKDVDVESDDGFLLRGTYHSAGKFAPGILLLHQCIADRRSYDNLATMLAGASFNVLTMDSRGFGDSSSGRYVTRQAQMDALMPKFPEDVAAAHEFLISQPEVDKRSIGVGGASCNVSMAVLLAQRHPEVRTLVLLSGLVHEAGKNFIKRSSNLPILVAASEEDDPKQIAKPTVELSGNKASKLLMYKGGGHGTDMFAKEKELESEIVSWFKSHLKPAS